MPVSVPEDCGWIYLGTKRPEDLPNSTVRIGFSIVDKDGEEQIIAALVEVAHPVSMFGHVDRKAILLVEKPEYGLWAGRF